MNKFMVHENGIQFFMEKEIHVVYNNFIFIFVGCYWSSSKNR
jgi:hypothetical protein